MLSFMQVSVLGSHRQLYWRNSQAEYQQLHCQNEGGVPKQEASNIAASSYMDTALVAGLHKSAQSVRLSGNRSFRYEYSTLVLLDTVSSSEIA